MTTSVDDAVVETVPWTDNPRAPYTASRKLSRLEHLLVRGTISPRQADAGAWIAERHAAYYTPASVADPTELIPAAARDLFARWSRGQPTLTRTNKPRTPPPTFRPRNPSRDSRRSDGWTASRLDALTAWRRARTLLDSLTDYERGLVLQVVVHGWSVSRAAASLVRSPRVGGRVVADATNALRRALDAIADETEVVEDAPGQKAG
jgi:hypothetical protein